MENRHNTFIKIVENLQYLTLIGLLTAQCVVGKNFVVGQALYLFANAIAVYRSFALARPMADKMKDCACMGITIGLLAIYYIPILHIF
jgi:hypothetical protein